MRLARILSAVLIIVCLFVTIKNPNSKIKSNEMKIFSSDLPTSVDPLEYDLDQHHPFQSLLNIKLISEYKSPGIFGQLAKNWKNEASNTLWRFKIRSDVRFSNGEIVTANDVVSSFTRLLFKMKRAKSKNELLLALKGSKKITSPTSKFEGLSEKNGEIIFSFVRPIPNLLELLGFGLYAVAHRSSYDLKNGNWIKKQIQEYVTAGPYVVTQRKQKNITVSLRSDYPKNLISDKAFKQIDFSSSAESMNDADILIGTSDSSALPKTHKFIGGSGVSNIMYFQIFPWKLKSAPLSDLQFRQNLRERFYQNLFTKKLKVSRSFFPLLMKGIKEPATLKIQSRKLAKVLTEIKLYDYRPSKNTTVNEAYVSLEDSMNYFGAKIVRIKDFPLAKVFKNTNPNLKKYTAEISLMATGIVASNPESDIRLMFSKEGINLPDTDGRIHEELAKENFSPQKINELIYEQAVVWPVAHYTSGIWAKPHLDFSQYNTLLPLGELQWIGQK